MDDNVNRTIKDGANCTKKTSQFTNYTVLEDLMVTKVYLRASEDSITSARQKVHTFHAKIESVYNTVKKQQEDEEAKEAMWPNHL